jgi:ribosomal-protein-alanine N-acetyltransferase
MDRRVTEHTSWPPITSELIASVVDKTIADYDELKSLRWALARTSDDKLIGSCGYTRWSPEQGSVELAYDLAPMYWGVGLMSAAVRAAVAWALGTGSLSRVEAFVMTTNEPSIAVLERTGFRRESVLTGFRVARGVPRDFYGYSLVARAG